MSYIDESLLGNEYVYYRARRHWVIFILPALFTFLALAFLFQHNLLVLLGLIFLVLAMVQWIVASTAYNFSEYGVTNKRIVIKTGFIKSHSLEAMLQQISGITVQQSAIGNLLGYGTVIIKGNGGAFEPYTMIDKPLLFRRKVQEQIEKLSGSYSYESLSNSKKSNSNLIENRF